MEILVMSPSFEWISWNMSHGLAPALARMGHQATHCPIPDTNFKPLQLSHLGTIHKLNQLSATCDLAIITAAEKLDPLSWQNLDCPKALWFIDCAKMQWADYTPRYEHCLRLTPHAFFPAVQDAAHFRKPWLPFAVDTQIFHPYPNVTKTNGPSFVGHVYTQRSAWIANLHAYGINLETPTTKNIPWQTTEAHARAHAIELARLYCSCSAIVDGPPGGESHSTRATEVMACGRPLLTPALLGPAACNTAAFNPPPFTYDRDNPEELRALLQKPHLLSQRAHDCMQDMHGHHTLQQHLQFILRSVFPEPPLQNPPFRT